MNAARTAGAVAVCKEERVQPDHEYSRFLRRDFFSTEFKIILVCLEQNPKTRTPCFILLMQEIIKIPNANPLKLFSDIVPSSFADITRAFRGCFHGGSVHVSFRFKAKLFSRENLLRFRNVFFDIMIASKRPSALVKF